MPEPLRGVPLITIDACFTGDRAAGDELIAPLRALGEPIMDTFGPMPAAGLCRIHMDPEQPVPGLTAQAPIAELTDEAIEAFVANGPGPETGSTLLLAELRHLGGALARRSEGAGALDKLDFPFVMEAVGALMAPDAGETVPRDLKRLEDALAPFRASGGYFNFIDSPCDVDAILPAETCSRLAEVKRTGTPTARSSPTTRSRSATPPSRGPHELGRLARRVDRGGERLGLGLPLERHPDVGDQAAEADPHPLLVGAEELALVVALDLRRAQVRQRHPVLLGPPAQDLQVGAVERQGPVVEALEHLHGASLLHRTNE